MRSLAKGFKEGILFERDNRTPKGLRDNNYEYLPSEMTEKIEEKSESVNLLAMVHEQENLLGNWYHPVEDHVEATKTTKESVTDDNSELDLLKFDADDDLRIPIISTTDDPSKKKQHLHAEWAEQLDVSVPVTDFHKRVPDPALTFPYELDTFQKQAIIKLEEGSNVFVAAHTSAGKTTIAEYAIALSKKHMTR